MDDSEPQKLPQYDLPSEEISEGEIDKLMNLPSREDILIGNDVWIGYEALIWIVISPP